MTIRWIFPEAGTLQMAEIYLHNLPAVAFEKQEYVFEKRAFERFLALWGVYTR